MLRFALTVVAAVLLASPAGLAQDKDKDARKALKKSLKSGEPMIGHMVYFKLKDRSPAARQKLVAACDKYLSDHDGTIFYSAGPIAAVWDRDARSLRPIRQLDRGSRRGNRRFEGGAWRPLKLLSRPHGRFAHRLKAWSRAVGHCGNDCAPSGRRGCPADIDKQRFPRSDGVGLLRTTPGRGPQQRTHEREYDDRR